MVNPWDRQPDEPDLWFERFDKYYRQQGPGRTLSEAYYQYREEKDGKRPERYGYTDNWNDKAKEWNWEERARAWDAHIRQKTLKVEEEEIKEMTRRHIKNSYTIQDLAMDAVVDHGFKNANEAVRAFLNAADLERKARGVPDQLIEINEMDEDELRKRIATDLARASVRASSEGLQPPEIDGDSGSDEEGEGS